MLAMHRVTVMQHQAAILALMLDLVGRLQDRLEELQEQGQAQRMMMMEMMRPRRPIISTSP